MEICICFYVGHKHTLLYSLLLYLKLINIRKWNYHDSLNKKLALLSLYFYLNLYHITYHLIFLISKYQPSLLIGIYDDSFRTFLSWNYKEMFPWLLIHYLIYIYILIYLNIYISQPIIIIIYVVIIFSDSSKLFKILS